MCSNMWKPSNTQGTRDCPSLAAALWDPSPLLLGDCHRLFPPVAVVLFLDTRESFFGWPGDQRCGFDVNLEGCLSTSDKTGAGPV